MRLMTRALPQWTWTVTNADTPTTTPGTSVIPGASDAEGSWTQVLTATAHDAYFVLLTVSDGSTATNAKNHLLDVGIDTAGGSSYTERITNMVCGGSGTAATGGLSYGFYCFIPSGSTVAVRIQGSNATAGTVRVQVTLFGRPANPAVVPVGMFTETIGTITGSLGVGLTGGNSGAEGAWVSLGTSTRRCWWWQLCAQFDNGTLTAQPYHFDLAYGDGTTKVIILENCQFAVSGSSEAFLNLRQVNAYFDVPAGATLYARASASGTANTGINVVAIGCGGLN